jgi:NTP pyrophosphatase (non-canonical NTP hydrolase)
LNEGSLNALAGRIFNNAKSHGFHPDFENIPEKLMLIVSELGEACEALRIGRRFLLKDFKGAGEGAFERHCKDTFEDELADVIIRTLDLAASLGVDIDFHVAEKMRYNEGRPFLHGKLF